MEELTPEQLKAKLDAGEEVIILDVRRADERDYQHIPNSLHIPLQELEQRVGELEPFKDKEIVVYCRSGNRSAHACMYLTMMGFKNPKNLRGGLIAW
ncbi:MAG: rhodanese-like domain-containing protein [Ignavibacteria bacterium]|jgi:rhodanese-related sulfurtransferase|nr:rhodanese-like domain-containing protein [Ignavibacteria bacterium]